MAIDARSFKILDRLELERYQPVAKLIRWGIDAHMGVLFGVTNQLIQTLLGSGLCVTVI